MGPCRATLDHSSSSCAATPLPSTEQVETEGDALVCCALSPTGECIAFGGSGGYVHIWAPSQAPSAAGMGQELSAPAPPTPGVPLGEDDSMAMAPTYFPAGQIPGGDSCVRIGRRPAHAIGTQPTPAECMHEPQREAPAMPFTPRRRRATAERRGAARGDERGAAAARDRPSAAGQYEAGSAGLQGCTWVLPPSP